MSKIYQYIEEINGSVIKLRAKGVAYGELALVQSAWGKSLAEVIQLQEDLVSLQVFKGARGIKKNDKVTFLSTLSQVSFTDDLIGRIFNALGEPRDGGPELKENLIEAEGPVVNPIMRQRPQRMIRTGIPMIDVFNTLVESQKLPIFSSSGEPYNALLARIALQADADVILLGCIGLKFDDYLFFKNTFEKNGALTRSILFVHTAADPVAEALAVPKMVLALGEAFALQNKKVLVLLNDMTNYANALKEIAITMEKVPSNRGYPGDLYSQLAIHYEKAVNLRDSGSLTVLAVTTMPGDDVTHPIPDNTGYITEGQFYLKNGHIEPFGSLSRLKQAVNSETREDHRAIMDGMIKLYASSRQSQEKRIMGFKLTNWDEKLINFGEAFESTMMNLEINLTLEQALDEAWLILSQCFLPHETGLRSDLVQKFWPLPINN